MPPQGAPQYAPPGQYGMPPPQGQQVIVMQGQNPIPRRDMPCCPDSEVDVSESMALIVFIINIISPGFGTMISACADRNGCNCSAFWVGILQEFTVLFCCIGYVWSIMHGYALYDAKREQ